MPRVVPVSTTVFRPGAASQQQALPAQNPQQANEELSRWAAIPRHNSEQAYAVKEQLSAAITAAVSKGGAVPAIEANYDGPDKDELVELMRKQGIQLTLVPSLAPSELNGGKSVVPPSAPRVPRTNSPRRRLSSVEEPAAPALQPDEDHRVTLIKGDIDCYIKNVQFKAGLSLLNRTAKASGNLCAATAKVLRNIHDELNNDKAAQRQLIIELAGAVADAARYEKLDIPTHAELAKHDVFVPQLFWETLEPITGKNRV